MNSKNIVPHFCFAFLMLAVGTHVSAADLAVTGDLSVTGNASVDGTLFDLGGGTNSAPLADGDPGIVFAYNDGDSGSLLFKSFRTASSWHWMHATTTLGVDAVQMSLGDDNSLLLYNLDSTPIATIKLDPAGTSEFGLNVIFDGTDNTMPGQTITGNASVLTIGLGDVRYLHAGTTLAVGTGTATGSYAYSLGDLTDASGNYTLAIGHDSEAAGESSVAMGESSIAGATASFAVGDHSSAQGGHASVAMGHYALAEGYVSLSAGQFTYTLGSFSTALGSNTNATGFGQLVAGQFNIAQGTFDSWVPTDDLFILGNGSDHEHRSNAFVVKKNGDTAVSGDATVTGKITTNGLDANGPVIFYGPVSVPPQGDLPMGDFTGVD